ncbi:hypothetical protein O6H91_02G066400 [Diphasiastrum complanatum]|uniref:Uncharacterized protein n=1 Tax=Diphasiastrum complanatum TaxID=34168 RepID=A0ACC2EGJ0_DIPCM|nr:hypothetical protein O6H91_Y508400 [Diphasiastrum complanatum]KAJ7565601.1 hypothetical protein O6H91_02G066400 [Diphasiastrum complanatum]
MEVGWAAGLAASFLVSWTAAAYCYWYVRWLPKGAPRLLASIPVFATYSILPLVFSRETHILGVALNFCIFTWMGSFKVLLLCWDRGPACDPWVLASFLRFAVVMSFPAHIRREGRVVKKHVPVGSPWLHRLMKAETWSMLIVRSVLKLMLLVALCLRALPFRDALPQIAIYALYTILLYLFVTIVLETFAAIANSLFGIIVEPHFDNPLAAASLEEFWARRWNLLVSNSLREVVYQPVLAALKDRTRKHVLKTSEEQPGNHSRATNDALKQSLHRRSSNGVERSFPEGRHGLEKEEQNYGVAKFWAMLATFFASGIAHELAVYYLTLQVTGEMTAFFTLHGLATGLEAAWSSYAPKTRPPKIICRFLTLGFCFITACWLFWPPVARGADLEVIAEMQSFIQLFQFKFVSG